MNEIIVVKVLEKLKNKYKKTKSGDHLVFLAGTNLYNDMWCRDAFFGILGYMCSREYISHNYLDLNMDEYVRHYLDTFSKYQRNDGLIPLKIGHTPFSYMTKLISNYYHDNNCYPVYKDDKLYSEPTDSNPQFIIIAYLYCKLIEPKYINVVWPHVKKAMEYTMSKLKDGMLFGKPFNSWYDSFLINGPDSFSNVLFLYSIKCYNNFKLSGNKINYNDFEKQFIKNFWNSDEGFIKISPKMNNLEIVSNSLTIIFDLVDETKKNRIMNKMNQINEKNDFLLNVVYPKLSKKHLWKPLYIVGMQGYHNDRIWPWVHYIYLSAKTKMGQDISYDKLPIENSFMKYGTMFESVVPDKQGLHAPMNHYFQNSEIDFTYALGMYLMLTFGCSSIFDVKPLNF